MVITLRSANTAFIPYKQQGTMQMAVQLGGALFISYKFGPLINSGGRMTLMLPYCRCAEFELRTLNNGNMQGD